MLFLSTAQIHLFLLSSSKLLHLLPAALTLVLVSWQEPQVPMRPVNVALLALGELCASGGGGGGGGG